MADDRVVVTGAEIRTGDGQVAALVELVRVGGGIRTVSVDGTLEERLSPSSVVYHVRLISPDRMLSDELRELPTYEEAVDLGRAYAAKLAEHAERLEALRADLEV